MATSNLPAARTEAKTNNPMKHFISDVGFNWTEKNHQVLETINSFFSYRSFSKLFRWRSVDLSSANWTELKAKTLTLTMSRWLRAVGDAHIEKNTHLRLAKGVTEKSCVAQSGFRALPVNKPWRRKRGMIENGRTCLRREHSLGFSSPDGAWAAVFTWASRSRTVKKLLLVEHLNVFRQMLNIRRYAQYFDNDL